MKVIVIGGGAGGMMAALTAAENKTNTVTLLERQNRVGRKLLATGNGRCNLSNIHADISHYHGDDPSFAKIALERFGVQDTLDYFKSLGLLTVTEASGKVYPFSDQANSVVDVLRFALQRTNIDVRCSCEVIAISKKARGYSVKTADESFYCDKLIVACGGAAGSKLGGTELGYKLLSSMGHSCTPIAPALVQLKTDTAFTHALKGVRADAGITLKHNGSVLLRNAGEVQFTDFGISGPAVFEISRFAAPGDLLLLDLLRPMEEAELTEYLLQKQALTPDMPLEDLLTGMVHNRLGRVILQKGGWDLSSPTHTADMKKLAHLIKFFPLDITGTMGLDQAQVTAGGIRTSEFRADTMESRLNPGLFATGEVLDIDGDCGGYNLQWAWSSGRLAGKLGGE
ncbi:MAG: aminoacetone oxidase family FAD-binding enzyme [Oscillospiraceae bacterium]|nr:aminoacetone oxidase family FAD-binding enzyme [Oscillospiraceae bacterium]